MNTEPRGNHHCTCVRIVAYQLPSHRLQQKYLTLRAYGRRDTVRLSPFPIRCETGRSCAVLQQMPGSCFLSYAREGFIILLRNGCILCSEASYEPRKGWNEYSTHALWAMVCITCSDKEQCCNSEERSSLFRIGE